MWVPFDVSNFVRIKLFDRGKRILKEKGYCVVRSDKEEYYIFNFWTVMNVFGEYVYPGCTPPFEISIGIEMEENVMDGKIKKDVVSRCDVLFIESREEEGKKIKVVLIRWSTFSSKIMNIIDTSVYTLELYREVLGSKGSSFKAFCVEDNTETEMIRKAIELFNTSVESCFV